MMSLDLRVLSAIYGGSSVWTAWRVCMVGSTLVGGGWAVLALIPLLAWLRTRRFAFALTLAIVVQATTVWALKLLVGRQRPWIALGLPPPIGAPHDGSFPSGHAAGSFCVAAFLAIALPDGSGGWRALPFVFAVLTGVSRVYLGAHFPSDVLAGAILGAVIGGAGGGLYVARESERTEGGRALPP